MNTLNSSYCAGGWRLYLDSNGKYVTLSLKDTHGPSVKWSVFIVKHGTEAQPAPVKPRMTRDRKRLRA